MVEKEQEGMNLRIDHIEVSNTITLNFTITTKNEKLRKIIEKAEHSKNPVVIKKVAIDNEFQGIRNPSKEKLSISMSIGDNQWR